ncbi:MAG: cysteine hydrolase, partial [Deltaproteobacteria bacterium]|nr:cysteine hydrolase [Deltaproteobacteria bacterium]
GRAIVPAVRRLLEEARRREFPVVFANDSFLPGDFLFGGRLKPHALRGTPGAEVIPELGPAAGDIVLPKRRFSAFYKTDLDQTLRLLGVDTVGICGITTGFCVLSTAFDALSLDFETVIVEDCCAAHKREVHDGCLALYRKNALWPLFRVQSSDEFLAGSRDARSAAG